MLPHILDRAPPPPTSRIPYGRGPFHFGDLRLPAGSGPHPVVLCLHGGYWRAHYDLGYMGHLCAALTAHGLATWNVEYRRIGHPGGGWPGTLTDVAAAADALRAIAPEHDLALDRVLALGHSAGGHLALWLAGRHRIPPGTAVSATDPLPLRGVVALAPVADLHIAFARHLSNDAVVELLGGGPQEVPDRYALASPASLLPLGIPQTLIHGRADEAVPFAMSRRYAETARAAGDPARLIAFDGDHFDPVDPASPIWPDVLHAVLSLLTGESSTPTLSPQRKTRPHEATGSMETDSKRLMSRHAPKRDARGREPEPK